LIVNKLPFSRQPKPVRHGRREVAQDRFKFGKPGSISRSVRDRGRERQRDREGERYYGRMLVLALPGCAAARRDRGERLVVIMSD
jgi:hypothetical protein